MNITDEVELVAPGFKRQDVSSTWDGPYRIGYYTPCLARWSDKNGFEKKIVLQQHRYESGVKITGDYVNASPVVCILESENSERDLEVRITGNIGTPTGSVVSGTQTITGFAKDHQYGIDIYRREWTIGSEYNYSFFIDKHEVPGKTYLLPNKRIYEITNVGVFVSGTNNTARREDFPLLDLGFYALADNGSKLLYTFNWNKVFENLRKVIYSPFAAPRTCATCSGSGTVNDYTCEQCNGYGYSGWNASGVILDNIGEFENVTQETGETLAEYQDKIWARRWQLTPTKKEIQRYFAHFARVDENEVSVENNFRSTSTSGVESIVDIKLPFTMPLSRFSTDSTVWNTMTENAEPAGINIRFSFLVSGNFTGTYDYEETNSVYMDYYSGAVLYTGYSTGGTGLYVDNYGFYEAKFGFVNPAKFSGWYQEWCCPWFYYNIVSGADDGISGNAVISGSTYSYISGVLKGSEWVRWARPSGDLENGGTWRTGDSDEINQSYLWTSGTYIWDNFWVSGGGGTGVIY